VFDTVEWTSVAVIRLWHGVSKWLRCVGCLVGAVDTVAVFIMAWVERRLTRQCCLMYLPAQAVVGKAKCRHSLTRSASFQSTAAPQPHEPRECCRRTDVVTAAASAVVTKCELVASWLRQTRSVLAAATSLVSTHSRSLIHSFVCWLSFVVS